MILADIPGLIKDAHKGKGAGIKFLGHIERCKVLIHLLDATSQELEADYKTVLDELYNTAGSESGIVIYGSLKLHYAQCS